MKPFGARTQTAEAAVALLPSTSSFDFLEGAFSIAQRSRAVVLGVSSVLILALSCFVLLGLNGFFSAHNEASALVDAQTANDLAVRQLGSIDNAEGFSADTLTAHNSERDKAYRSAVANEVDFASLVAQLEATATSLGVDVNNVKLLAPVPAAPVNAAPVGGAPATPAPSATPVPAPTGSSSQLGDIEIHGVVHSFAMIGVWSQAVAKMPGLTAVAPTWSGGEPSIQVTIRATITPADQTARAKALATPSAKAT